MGYESRTLLKENVVCLQYDKATLTLGRPVQYGSRVQVSYTLTAKNPLNKTASQRHGGHRHVLVNRRALSLLGCARNGLALIVAPRNIQTRKQFMFSFHRSSRIITVLLIASMLAACGGGGGGGTVSPRPEVEVDRSDPRLMRLEQIIRQADTILVPGVHIDYSVSQPAQVSDRQFQPMSCSGTTCTADDGTTITEQDFLGPVLDVDPSELTITARHGFDTAALEATLNPSDFEGFLPFLGATISSLPSVTSYGFWGDYGFAGVSIADGPMAGQYLGVSFNGEFKTATSVAGGAATGTNPGGVGAATWSGVAEAASTQTFERHQGTATLTIADLSAPSISVSIDVPEYAINAPGWSAIPLDAGTFSTGFVGSDYLEGNFYGPEHDEAYGVFDTGSYVGAFGGKR